MFLQELNLKEKKNFLELAHYIMTVDGKTDEVELNMFNNFRAEVRLGEDDYVIKKKSIKDIITEFNASKKRTKKVVMYQIFGIILSNHEYHENQKQTIELLQKEWNFRDYDIKKIMRWVEDFNDLLTEAIINLGE